MKVRFAIIEGDLFVDVGGRTSGPLPLAFVCRELDQKRCAHAHTRKTEAFEVDDHLRPVDGGLVA